MQLTRTERWMLSNQLKILAHLDEDSAEYYEEMRESIEHGYEHMYSWYCEHIYDGSNTMSSEESKEVIDILAMFDRIERAYDSMSDKTGIEEFQVRFAGFDGNNETKQMGFAGFFMRSGGGRFSNLREGRDVNSHMPVLDRYRRQLAVFRQRVTDPMQMTRDDVVAIAQAAIHPSHRGA